MASKKQSSLRFIEIILPLGFIVLSLVLLLVVFDEGFASFFPRAARQALTIADFGGGIIRRPSLTCTTEATMTLPTTPYNRYRPIALEDTTSKVFVIGRSSAASSSPFAYGVLPFVNGTGTSTVYEFGGGNMTPDNGLFTFKGAEKDSATQDVYSVVNFRNYYIPSQPLVYRLYKGTMNANSTAQYDFPIDATSSQPAWKFVSPYGISIINRNGKKLMFVADQSGSWTRNTDPQYPHRNRIVVYELPSGSTPFVESNYITGFGSISVPSGNQLVKPFDVEVDAVNNKMYVIDFVHPYPGNPLNENAKVIYQYSLSYDSLTNKPTSAAYIKTVATFGTGNGQVNGPSGMDIDPITSNLYVADTLNNRVQVFDSAGNYIDHFSAPGVTDVEIDATGRAYVYDAITVQKVNCGTAVTPTPTPIQGPTNTPTPGGGTVFKAFITSLSYSSNLGGLAGADAKCQARASAAGLPGTYKAWLSDSTAHARNRIVNGIYKRVDGATIANSLTDLTDGTIQNPINLTETGSYRGAYVNTGTLANGNASTSNNCSNWTSNSSTLKKTWGRSLSIDGVWTNYNTENICSLSYPLYCFQVTP